MLLAAACAQPTPARDANGPADEATAAAEPAAPAARGQRLALTPAEVAAAGLPPVAVELAPWPEGLEARTLPGGHTYLELVGADETRAGLRVESYAGIPQNGAGLASQVRKRQGPAYLNLGVTEQIALAGVDGIAIGFATGPLEERVAHVLALLPRAPDGDQGVLVEIWGPAPTSGRPAPSVYLQGEPQASLAAALRVRFE